MENVHQDFRLWGCVHPYNNISHKMTENCVKVAIENPHDFQSKMMKALNLLNEKEIMECKKKDECLKILYGCCMFYSMILERQQYTTETWGILNTFCVNDFMMCQKIVIEMMNCCS